MIILYDINKELVDAWKEVFKDIKEVIPMQISFEVLQADYVVTAGNSYGWMTGGIDLAVRNYYGYEVQDEIQRRIVLEYDGYLPVGEYLILATGNKSKPFLIYAPTMEKPKYINSIEVMYVSMVLFDLAKSLDLNNKTFAICGLGTATGGVSAKDCAKAMRVAYDFIMKQN